MAVISEDISERLDVIPAPAQLIENGIPTEALVAHVAVSHYADHQPLHRQPRTIVRQGVIVDRSTLSFWIGHAAAEVAPAVTQLREMMLAVTRKFVDETVVPVLDLGCVRTSRGYFGRLPVTRRRSAGGGLRLRAR